MRIVGPSWKVVRSFQAHDVGSIKHMRQVEGTSLLVTVAEDLGAGEPVLKVWALDKPEPKTRIPACLSTVTINNGKKPFPITAFTATEDLSQLAVGFGNGTVTLIRGNLVHDLGTKQRIIYESEEPVTGVEINVDPTNLTTVFIATTSRILKLVVSAKGHGQAPKTVEDSGCGLGCMTVDKKTGDIVVARDDAIYYYTIDGRGPPRAYDSPKKSVAVYQDYVALVSDPAATPAAPEPNSIRRRFGGAADSIFNPWTFTLLETDLKLVAHSESIISPIMATFQVWGDLYNLTQDGKVTYCPASHISCHVLTGKGLSLSREAASAKA